MKSVAAIDCVHAVTGAGKIPIPTVTSTDTAMMVLYTLFVDERSG